METDDREGKGVGVAKVSGDKRRSSISRYRDRVKRRRVLRKLVNRRS